MGLVLEEPDVVFVFVGIEGDLLLLGAGGVHVLMRVEVAALGVVVAETDSGAKGDVGGHIRHALGIQRGLELGRHEAISIARVDEAEKVDREHAHVEGRRNDDQAEDAREEMLEPNPRRHVPGVAQQDPELERSQAADPGNGEQADPLDAHGRTQAHTGRRQPKPPRRLERTTRAQLVLIDKARPAQRRHRREDHQRRIQQNEPRLRHQPILKHHQQRPQRRSETLAPRRLERQKHHRDHRHSAQRGQQPHRHVRHPRLHVILANILEIELAVEARQESGERDEQFGERRVDVHEEFAFDVLGGEATEVHFVEDDAGGLVDAEQADEEGEGGDGDQGLPVGGGKVEDVVVVDAGRGVRVRGVGRFVW